MEHLRGIYVLIISVVKDIKVNVGALGNVNFEKGLYAYVGSAQNNLERRIARYLRRSKRKFWHIDYLLGGEAANVLKVFYKEAGKHEECKIARKIREIGASIKGFGSSDCKCKSHLVKIQNCEFLECYHFLKISLK